MRSAKTNISRKWICDLRNGHRSGLSLAVLLSVWPYIEGTAIRTSSRCVSSKAGTYHAGTHHARDVIGDALSPKWRRAFAVAFVNPGVNHED
jgi:hypothetical protein